MEDLEPHPDAGETYVEILVTLVIMGLAGLAVLAALMTSISSSAIHRSIANVDYSIEAATESAAYQIEYSPTPLFQDCGPKTATDLISGWNPRIIWPAIPATGYQAWISKVECFTESSSTSALDPGCVSSQATPAALPTAVPAGACSADNSGIVQITVSIEDPSNVVTSQSTLVRNPGYGSYPSTSF